MPEEQSAEQFIEVERRDDGVAVVRLNRPKMNALSGELLRQLANALYDFHTEPPGAIVLTGGDRIFAAGADVTEFSVEGKGEQLVEPAGARTISGTFRFALDSLAAIPRMTIAAIAGYALGGGLELALACDLRIAADSAKLGQPEILLGIIPGGGASQRLTRLIGPSRAKELLCTGRQVSADEALRIGLVNEVVPAAELHDRALALAVQLAAGPVAAHALCKVAVDRALDEDLSEGLDIETDLFAEVFETEDAAIGVRSFLEHGPGKAKFTGR
jgi:enoyl-CoA hydratase